MKIMTNLEILLIAVALAMDAFAVAIATGIQLRKIHFRQYFRLCFHFGLFQAMMTVIGWTLGHSVRRYIEIYDHWIAFGLLCIVGGRMIYESLNPDEKEKLHDPTKGFSLVFLSIATSIDALAVGLSMAVLFQPIVFPALIIGIIALLFTYTGLELGKRVGSIKKISTSAELLGGIVLIIIGLNILKEHGVFSQL